MSKKLFGLNIKLIGKRLIDGEYLIIATNSDLPNLNEYAKRWLLSLVEVWKIELMFSAFKIRGFNFESTKVTQPEKLEKLIALLSITFCWAYAVGEVRNKEKPITFRQDLNTLSKSIFHYGLEFIRTAFLNPIHKHTSIVKSIKILLSYIQGPSCFVVE